MSINIYKLVFGLSRRLTDSLPRSGPQDRLVRSGGGRLRAVCKNCGAVVEYRSRCEACGAPKSTCF